VAEAAGDSTGAWRSLGGRFVDRIAAVARGDAIELFALDREGAVSHRRLAGNSGTKGEWQRIGDGAVGELTAVPVGEDGCAVFVLGRGGAILHRLLRRGEWQTDGWQTVRGGEGAMLGAVPAGPGGVTLALIDEDMALRTLQWTDYPKRPPEWIAQGDLQDWLVGAGAPQKAGKMRRALSA
jgi:hypothetical protein